MRKHRWAFRHEVTHYSNQWQLFAAKETGELYKQHSHYGFTPLTEVVEPRKEIGERGGGESGRIIASLSASYAVPALELLTATTVGEEQHMPHYLWLAQ